MTVTHRRRAKKERRPEFLKAWPIEYFVEWLNGPGDGSYRKWVEGLARRFPGLLFITGPLDIQARANITELIEDLKELTRRAEALMGRPPVTKDDQLLWNSFNTAVDAVAEKLRPYASQHTVVSNEMGFKKGRWESFAPGRAAFFWTTAYGSIVPQEMRAVEVLRELVNSQSLKLLLPCKICGRWFVGRSWSQCCEKAVCRKEWRLRYQKSPEYKNRRNKIKKHPLAGD
jgi:hypothetical protein